jgi:hypothetical protein
MKLLFIFSLLFAGSLGPNYNKIADRDPTNPGLKEVLLLGDSVMAGIGRSKQGMDYLAKHHSYIFGAVGCQRLATTGCTKSSKLSALEILKMNSRSFTKAVVVSTGYNDYNNANLFRTYVREICLEAKKQGVSVYWLTYREKGNVMKKSRSYNKVLDSEASNNPDLHIIDWNLISSDKKGWFSGDEIHLQGVGPLKMAQIISDSLTLAISLTSD